MLGYLPYTSQVKLLLKTSELDEWGKPVVSESEELYKCYIREASKLDTQFNSPEFTVSLVFGIEGNADIKAGDTIQHDHIKYIVHKSRKIRDLSGEVITLLVYV